MMPKMDPAKALREFVTPEPNTGCWLWTRNVDSAGYARLGEAQLKMHRYSYAVAHGLQVSDLRRDQYVCHRCDQPSCVNPTHLFLGTALDNMRDKVRKGRMRGHFKTGPDSRRGLGARVR
jgi:hypothetical protein